MEIGSLLEINPMDLFLNVDDNQQLNELLHEDKFYITYFNTGRSAIEAILKYEKEKKRDVKIYMPSFICSSVYEAAIRAKVSVEVYQTEKDMSVKLETIDNLDVKQGDIIYILQYFGKTYSCSFIELLNGLREKGIKIIEDVSLSLLSVNNKYVWFGDYVLGSLRKWFPIPDGGFLATRESVNITGIEKSTNDYSFYYFVAQIMKNYYLNNPLLDKQQFLKISNEGMKILFSDYTIRKISQIAFKLINTLDIKTMQQKRIQAYDYLYAKLSSIEKIELLVKREEGMIPLGMFIVCENRDKLFKWLIDNNIYCNIHWRNNEYTKKFETSEWLSEHCLTIPCDYRYGVKEMDYIVEKIEEFVKGEKNV